MLAEWKYFPNRPIKKNAQVVPGIYGSDKTRFHSISHSKTMNFDKIPLFIFSVESIFVCLFYTVISLSTLYQTMIETSPLEVTYNLFHPDLPHNK